MKPKHTFQINNIKRNQFIEVEVFDEDDRSVLVQKFEVTPSCTLEVVKGQLKTLLKRNDNLDDFRSKLGKKLDL